MTKKEDLVTVKEGASRETILELMHQNRVEKVLVVDDAFKAPTAAPTRKRPNSSLHAFGFCSAFWKSLTVIMPSQATLLSMLKIT